VAGKKGGTRSSIRNPSVYSLSPPPPFFPAFNNSIVAGKKGGGRNYFIIWKSLGISSLILFTIVFCIQFSWHPAPSLLPGHYAIIKGREEGRGKELFYYLYLISKSILYSHTIQRLVFWHQEVASDSFCFLINSPWLSVFILIFFFLFFSGFNLYCWKGIHFS